MLLQSLFYVCIATRCQEQRFGVRQRDSLADLTNALFTTATPLPRSLMLLLDADYAVTTLRTKVGGDDNKEGLGHPSPYPSGFDMVSLYCAWQPPLKRPVKTLLLGTSQTGRLIERVAWHVGHNSKVQPYLITSSPSSSPYLIERVAWHVGHNSKVFWVAPHILHPLYQAPVQAPF